MFLRFNCQKLTIPLRTFNRNLNANRATVTSVNRARVTRTYPVVLVQPDGSTFQIRYDVPRQLIYLPINLDNCSDEDKLKIQRLRYKRTKVETVDDFEGSFDPTKYL